MIRQLTATIFLFVAATNALKLGDEARVEPSIYAETTSHTIPEEQKKAMLDCKHSHGKWNDTTLKCDHKK